MFSNTFCQESSTELLNLTPDRDRLQSFGPVSGKLEEVDNKKMIYSASMNLTFPVPEGEVTGSTVKITFLDH